MIGPEHLPRPGGPPGIPEQKGENHQLRPRLPKLHRKKGHAVGPGNGVSECYAPGGRSRPSIAAAGAKTAYPPHGVHQRQGGHQHREEVGQAEPSIFGRPPGRRHTAEKAAVKHHAAGEIAGIELPWLLPEQGQLHSQPGHEGEQVE